jgi:hypothetical protein
MAGERIRHNSAQTTSKAKDSWRIYSEQSVRELELLAGFYHKHGYAKEAAEIRQAIANLRQHSDRAKSTKLGEKKS